MTLLHGLGVPELFSPELTAGWEYKLLQMQEGKLSRATFMTEIEDMTRRIVGQAKNYEADTIPGDFGKIEAPCPKCGSEIHENYKKFQCQKCEFAFWKIIAGRQLEPSEASTLITARDVGPLDGFRSKMGRAFSANLILNAENVIEFSWGDKEGEGDEPPDFTGQEPLGACPKCAARVFEMPNAYACEKALGAARTCDFRSGRIILQRPIEREQMEKLLQTGKTDLLDKFISKKNRPFSAYLVRGPEGKVGFEFEPRAEGGKKGAAASSSALRVLGKHPVDDQIISVSSGRYGPYVKYGKINATLPDKEKFDSITLEEAIALLSERDDYAPKKPVAKKPAAKQTAAKKPAAKKPVTKKMSADDTVPAKAPARKKKTA